ncbi:hypothetical protein PCANC_16730 [Puccinia coronata f. sp. avenae]|uniref:Uncharacterized protein n=1 Tax=Puccinia coronata f. sp. avenae TaxID=200324 RepID=A0A2N5VBC5_9BASI|nr:hypothetical protein PCANC_17230 [Puccinia coronata f. sp. avenae]PLW31407.1 hypothetical protein PCANC_16730 [Puccinia coronata f. sp. avenae]PLW47298.1 hypothetical protein PCASD_02631 [Puccinia coronata f. sp. avenae]
MAKVWFILLSTLLLLNAISARSSLHAILRRAVKGVSYYIGNMGAIGTDLMKNTDPKEECVFYVNTRDSNRSRDAAIAFAGMRNQQLVASGGSAVANTLYDAFNLDLAFGYEGELMREAMAGGDQYLRTYFKVTSGAYARLCRGRVWLIVNRGEEIYHDAIWLTHEYPELIRPNSGVTGIFEIDPAEIEAALRLNDPNRDLHPRPYRGGFPPGWAPPRSIDTITFDKKDVPSIQSKIDEYAKYPDVEHDSQPPKETTPPQCDMSDSSRVPYNVFDGVYGRFCENTLTNSPLNPLSQIVDSHGYVIPPKKRSLSKRTPPPNPDAYQDYKFGLSWSGGKGACSLSCNEAFKAGSTSPCGHTAGQQNIMSTSGTVEAGCGQYKWTIVKPPGTDPAPSPPTVSSVQCNAADKFGKHGDINPGFQNQYTGFACVGSAFKNLKPGDPDVTFSTKTNGTPYNYKISWVSGCKTTVSQMNVYQPIPNDDKNTCLNLLRRTFTECNNGGVGGSIDVGCLRYEFHP